MGVTLAGSACRLESATIREAIHRSQRLCFFQELGQLLFERAQPPFICCPTLLLALHREGEDLDHRFNRKLTLQIREHLKCHTQALENLAVELLARGLSVRDIQDAFKDESGRLLLSRTAVSELGDRLWEDYQAFAERDLSEYEIVDSAFPSLATAALTETLSRDPCGLIGTVFSLRSVSVAASKHSRYPLD